MPKNCPKCRRLFEDSQSFCQEDGTTLLDVSNTGQAPTVFFTSESSPTLFVPRPNADIQNSSNGIPGWLYVVLGAMAATIITLGATFFVTRVPAERGAAKIEPTTKVSEPISNTNQPNTETKTNEPTTSKSNTISLSSTPRPMPSINPNLNPSGSWKGDWSSSSGAYLTADVNLNDNGGGQIQGQIVWTLKRTVDVKKMDKIGYTATEYVRGKFNPSNRELSLVGYSKNDPNNVLANLDSYRLVLTQDNQEVRGVTKNFGRWNGRFNLRRF